MFLSWWCLHLALSDVLRGVSALLGSWCPFNLRWCRVVCHLAHFEARLDRHCVVEAALSVRVVQRSAAPLDSFQIAINPWILVTLGPA